MSDNINVLIAKARYLNLELKECDRLNDIYKGDFLKEVDSYNKRSLSFSMATDFVNKSIDVKPFSDVQPKKEISSHIKKIYKKIMSKVHPDKINRINDDGIKRKYSEMCSMANDAINDLDIYVLIDIADKLDIDFSSYNDNLKKDLEGCCLKYSNEINSIKNTYPWIWGNSEDSLKNAVIIEFVNKNK